MKYYISKTVSGNFENVIERITATLKEEGFGVLTEIDVKETLKKKINADFRKYVILGACNPHFAYRALQMEDKLGVFLPCNVMVQELDNGSIEVAAIDPNAMMNGIDNPALDDLASEVRMKLEKAVMGI